MGFALFIVAFILSVILYPLSFLTSVLINLLKPKEALRKLNQQFVDIAVSIDANGNVVADDENNCAENPNAITPTPTLYMDGTRFHLEWGADCGMTRLIGGFIYAPLGGYGGGLGQASGGAFDYDIICDWRGACDWTSVKGALLNSSGNWVFSNTVYR
jgi:hypothetical protein